MLVNAEIVDFRCKLVDFKGERRALGRGEVGEGGNKDFWRLWGRRDWLGLRLVGIT